MHHYFVVAELCYLCVFQYAMSQGRINSCGGPGTHHLVGGLVMGPEMYWYQ